MNHEEFLALTRRRKGKIFLNEGSSRKVYELDRYIIKKAKNKRGRMECHNEYWLYTNIPEEYKRFLCPVLYYKDGTIIMEKAKLVEDEYFKRYIESDFQYMIRFLFEQYGVDDFDLGYHFNWGVLNGQPVIIDYGNSYLGEEIGE